MSLVFRGGREAVYSTYSTYMSQREEAERQKITVRVGSRSEFSCQMTVAARKYSVSVIMWSPLNRH